MNFICPKKKETTTLLFVIVKMLAGSHFPKYLKTDKVPIYMKTIDDVILRLAKAPYRNVQIVQGLRVLVRGIKLSQIV